MTNNDMSVQEYVCAQHIYACAHSLNSVCARAQLIGNTDNKVMQNAFILSHYNVFQA